MTTVFIFKSNALGAQYGIGTYIKELTEALLNYTSLKIYLVSYCCSECQEFESEKISDKMFKINIPQPFQNITDYEKFNDRYANVILYFLKPFFAKEKKIVLHSNCMDSIQLMKKLKEKYPSFSLINVVHFSQWQFLFNGNDRKLSEINLNIPNTEADRVLMQEKQSYDLFDHIVTVTNFTKEYLQNIYKIDSNNISVIPNGIEWKNATEATKSQKLRIRKEFGFDKDETILLFAGRIDKGKGVFPLVESFVESCQANSNLRLIMAGQGIISEVLKKTKSHFGKITFTEYISKDQMQALYQIADIGILLSLYEQCPYTILEMMVHKIPLILSKIRGIDEIYNENQCLLIEPDRDEAGNLSFDTEKVKEAILKLSLEKELAKKMADQAYSNLHKLYSAKKMVKQMEYVYSLNKQNDL